jgi:hypothetical protein
MSKLWKWLLFIAIVGISFFFHVEEKIDPQISFTMTDKALLALPPAFPASQMGITPWETESFLAKSFYNQFDLYQAVVSFKKAAFLSESKDITFSQRSLYSAFFCYFLAKKYDDALFLFEHSSLHLVDKDFTPYHDLLVILYASYLLTPQTNNTFAIKADNIFGILKQAYPETAEKLLLWNQLIKAAQANRLSLSDKPFLKKAIDTFFSERKSPLTAELLNTALPGSGYLYLGQKQSTMTAFLLNTLFVAAAWHSFAAAHLAAGIIFTSFEMGWYYGGIIGAGEETNFYNTRLYESLLIPVMLENRLFPELMLHYGL